MGTIAMTNPSLPLDNDSILREAAAWVRAGKPAAIATVISTWGSSPRPVGSRLALDAEGHFIGSVSGGCVETAVVDAGQEVIRTGAPRVLEFSVADEEAWGVGLACGGRVKIYVEALN
jgi:xanthine/CO dehydrogenase XdhC/CoxF family maturation factor